MSRGLDELTKWRVKMLARFGGFSLDAIARQTGASVNQVSYYLGTQKITLKQWRDIETSEAKNHARSVTRAAHHKKRRRSA